MKILIEPSSKNNLYKENIDGLILSLKRYSVNSEVYYTKEEIKNIKEQNPNIEIFIRINKNLFNDDILNVEKELLYLDNLGLQGIMFYDLAILKLKKELNLKTNLVWDQTHMVNNYNTCNYYYDKGVKYALLSKEITKDEIMEIIRKSKITPIVEIIGMPTVAFSRRKLITNYYKDLNKIPKNKLIVTEKITNDNYELKEDENGTTFILKKITNGINVIKALYEANLEYILIKEYGLENINFYELLIDLKKYIKDNCNDTSFIKKYETLGDFTNFFYKKTISRVKRSDKK